uniref:TSL-kinase interacting protein 1-like n=1 Tax=Steinernema glaseri TaxID=37863 RepID=A0A1I7ZKS7_9BILA
MKQGDACNTKQEQLAGKMAKTPRSIMKATNIASWAALSRNVAVEKPVARVHSDRRSRGPQSRKLTKKNRACKAAFWNAIIEQKLVIGEQKLGAELQDKPPKVHTMIKTWHYRTTPGW